MNLTQLEKAKKLFERIKELDGQILELEKLAAFVVDEKCTIKLDLKVFNKVKAKKESVLDEDGSLRNPLAEYMHRSLYSGIWGMACDEKKEPKEEADQKFKETLPDNVAMKMVLFMIEWKQHIRGLALKQLQKLGVTI